MLDHRLRRLIDPPLHAAGRWLAGGGVSADAMTLGGFALGLAGAAAIAIGAFGAGLGLILANRLADGLDGAIARHSRKTDRGGFLDIALDFAFYASVPLAFAVADPSRNALAAAALLAAFLVNGAAFLAFAAIAAGRGMTTSAQGQKSLYYVAGLAEGAETIAVFVAMCLWPGTFALLAFAFAGLCLGSGLARIWLGWRLFGPPPASDRD